MRTRTLTSAAVALAAVATALPAALSPTTVAADAAVPARRIVVSSWDSSQQLKEGKSAGLTVRKGSLRLADPVATRGGFEYGRWVSPWTRPGFDLTELVPSWTGSTPGDSWVKIEVRGRSAAGASSWDTISNWALDDDGIARTSGGRQTDDLGRVAYDTWLTPGAFAFRLRVTLLRRTGSDAAPRVRAAGAMVSRLPSATGATTSKPGAEGGIALGKVLRVPRYSQMVHRGTYPQYDGGGEAWCSPTSTAMVLGYYDALPSPREYAWVKQGYPDRVVAHLARATYDSSFGGTGNWPFNTAYAGSKTKKAFVTRLRSLREAERFVAAGIPLVASVTFSAGELSGAPISSTNGHLMVIVGFTGNGDVVVNDPASPTRAGVRRTYDRGQFEDAWLKRYASGSSVRGSGGIVYVVHDRDHPLPARNGNRNW